MCKRIKFPCLRVLEARIAELQREYFHVEVVKMYDNVLFTLPKVWSGTIIPCCSVIINQ